MIRSWVNKSDCCSWDGITCDTKSGKVIGLDLSSSDLHGELKSNSSLFRLRHLRDLNLAYNNFTASPTPAEFDKLMELERLNLSKSSLSGLIPNELIQLTKLVSLDLSDHSSYPPSYSLSTYESFIHLLAQNFRNLTELDMNSENISSEIPNEFSNMRSLRLLDLSDCNLFGEFPSSVFLIPSLQSIRLSSNSNLRGNLPVFHENNSLLSLSIFDTAFSGTIPDSIGSLKHLTSLFLSFSKFSGKIPFSLGNLSLLSYLNLYSNNFVGEIPSSIGNLYQLTYFDVGGNKLSGNLPATISSLTQLRPSLSPNQFTGSLPPNFSELSKLNSFEAGGITGAILLSLLKIPSLTKIYLDYNQPNDLLGIANISLLPNLIDIRITHTSYNKVSLIDLKVFSPLKYLASLCLDGIPLSIANITFLTNCSALEVLNVGNNKINDMYYTSLVLMSKGVSMEMERILTIYTAIDFSGNQLHGQIPDSIGLLKELLILNMSSNAFIGHIPSSLTNLTNLESLDLSKNKISGEIPPELGTLSSLEVINVSHNQLEGSIPQGTQFQRQNCSSYEGNPGLNSLSLKDVCGDIKALKPPQPEPLETKEEEVEESLSWIAACLGFAPSCIWTGDWIQV